MSVTVRNRSTARRGQRRNSLVTEVVTASTMRPTESGPHALMEESAVRINQNIMAFNAYRNLANTQNMLAKSLEKLSSGYRINRAADDASGLVISQGLRAQVSGLRQATRNAQDGVSVVQTAEGALNEVHGMLNRVRDLIVQSANTASSDANARQAAQNEISQLRSEIDRIAGTTAFGTQKLLNGSFGAQVARATSVTTGIVSTAGVSVSSVGNSFTL